MDQVNFNWSISGLKYKAIGKNVTGVYYCFQQSTRFYKILKYDEKGIKMSEYDFSIPYSDLSINDTEISNKNTVVLCGVGTNNSGFLNYTFCFDSIGNRKWSFADSIFISDLEVLSDSVAVGVLKVKKTYNSILPGNYFVWINIDSGKFIKQMPLDSLLALNSKKSITGFWPREIKKSGDKIVLNCFKKSTREYFVKIINDTGGFYSESKMLIDNGSLFYVFNQSYFTSYATKIDKYGGNYILERFDFQHNKIFSYAMDTSFYNLVFGIEITDEKYTVLINSPFDSLYKIQPMELIWLNNSGEIYRKCTYKMIVNGYNLSSIQRTFDEGLFFEVSSRDWLGYNSAIMKTTSFGEIKNSEVTSQCTDYRVGVQEIKPLRNQPNQLKVYPNPTTNQVNIASELLIKTLTLYSITGEEKLKLSPNKKQINLSLAEFESGVYYVVAETEWGAERVKVVKW